MRILKDGRKTFWWILDPLFGMLIFYMVVGGALAFLFSPVCGWPLMLKCGGISLASIAVGLIILVIWGIMETVNDDKKRREWNDEALQGEAESNYLHDLLPRQEKLY